MTTLALLYSAMERLNNLLRGESGIKEVLDGVEQLNSDLGRVVGTLKDADATNRHIGPEVNRQVRELTYDMEGSVESFVRRREVEASSSASKWNSLRCLFKYCSSARSYERSFVEDLGVFSRRAGALVGSTGEGSSSSSSKDNLPIAEPQRMDRQYIRYTNPESFLIGLDEDVQHLKELLLGGGSLLSVIAICGMGGIGKTTLARSAYNHLLVREHFHICAWSTVSLDYQARDILEAILSSLSRDSNFSKIATMALTEKLYKSLKGRRYLLVLDDVWSTDAWESLRFIFPDDHNGSRILITTRSKEVARYTSMSQIEMKTLTDEQSWQLFLIKSGLQDTPGTSNPQIADTGKQIVRSCKGLPLAIIVIGQILSTRSLQSWELILQELHSKKEHVHSVLDLSYTSLPFHLKPCFLYMGHFPPDRPILVDKLHLLWMAEGLISKGKKAAEVYFNELVDRNLVMVVEKEDLLASRRFASGHLHDLIRDLCISRGKQEEFFEVIDSSHANKISSSTCRVAVYLDKLEDARDFLLSIPDSKRIRSIMFFDTIEPLLKLTWPIEVADLTYFQHIRVLDFDGVNFQVKRLPWGIEKLIYLRHLSFRGCYLQEFPSSFGNFSFLETLDLRVVDSCIMTIPNVLRKLSRLRNLYFPLQFRCDGKQKLNLDCLQNLEVLENFHADSCDAEDLLQLENLQILKGTVDGNNLDLTNIINSIKKMNSICHSSLVVKRFDCFSEERLSIVAELLQCEVVHAVDIEGHLRTLRPDFVFGFNLNKMVFNGSEFNGNHMKILGGLPNLKSLVLCNDAFLGPKLVCYESGFPQLKSLKLANIQSLKEWEVESGAMPRLTILTIEQCYKLEMIPSQLAEIPTLQKLMIGSMPQKFQLTVTEIIEKEMAFGNEEISVTFYDCDPLGVGSNQAKALTRSAYFLE